MTLIERLRQLSRAVSEEKWGEFSMRVPPDEDRDADFVLLRAAEEIESLRQQLADTKLVLGQAMTTVDDIQKSNVMLRDAIKFWMQAEGNYDLMKADKKFQEALASTADLKDVILCHAEPVAIVRVESFNTLRWLVESLPNGTKLYRAWEPK